MVRAHAKERYESGRFHRINKHVMRELMRARTARAISSPLVEVLSILVLGGLTVVAAGMGSTVTRGWCGPPRTA